MNPSSYSSFWPCKISLEFACWNAMKVFNLARVCCWIVPVGTAYLWASFASAWWAEGAVVLAVALLATGAVALAAAAAAVVFLSTWTYS